MTRPGRGPWAGVFRAAVLAWSVGGSAAAATCTMNPADAAWVQGAIANWRLAERNFLKLSPQPLPTIIVADGDCTYTARAGQRGLLQWTGVRHGGTVRFPDGKQQSVGPLAFAAPDAGAAASGYFAMTLPSVWRRAGVSSKLGLERLMDGVMLHELMHTRQFYFANPALSALTRRYGLGDDIGDDSLQARFESDPAYVAAYQAERDALFAAAVAPDEEQARALADKALGLMRERRARWFSGDAAQWLPLDDIFLTMEGLGQWLAYRWLTSLEGAKVPAAVALPEVRRGGKYWSQDEGLALFLTIDRLLPDWQALAFAPKPTLAEELLARAAGRN